MALDWFYLTAGFMLVLQLAFQCFSLATCLIMLLIMALIRYVLIPSDADLTLQFYEKFGKPVESLKGRVIWITGASSGIGAALAIKLASAGARLVISARSLEGLKMVKESCLATKAVKDSDVLIITLDMVKYEDHHPAFEQVIKHFGELDILVNNAGRSQRARWEMVDTEVDKEIFELNVFSLIALSRIVVKYFLKKGSGHIAVTSSTAGKAGVPMSCSYTASKHALHGYFECLRFEKLGSNIAVTMLCPGPVDSNLLNVCFTEKHGEQLGQERVGKRMSTARCADLCAIAIANQLSEVWLADFPVLPLFYAVQYFPTLVKMGFKIIGVKAAMKMRDGRDDVVADN